MITSNGGVFMQAALSKLQTTLASWQLPTHGFLLKPVQLYLSWLRNRNGTWFIDYKINNFVTYNKKAREKLSFESIESG